MGVVAPGGPGGEGGDLLVSDEEMEAAGKSYLLLFSVFCQHEGNIGEKGSSLLTKFFEKF